MAKKENKFVKVTRQEEIANVNFGLGRPFDFEDRFNRIAFMGTLISAVVLLIIRMVTRTGSGSVMLDGVS